VPIIMNVDHARKQVDTVALGRITYAEVEKHLLQERCFEGLAYKELIDARSAALSFALYPSEIRNTVALIRSLSKEFKFGPTAIMVPNDYAVGIIHMLGFLVEDVAELRPFRDEQEARSWLAAQQVN